MRLFLYYLANNTLPTEFYRNIDNIIQMAKQIAEEKNVSVDNALAAMEIAAAIELRGE